MEFPVSLSAASILAAADRPGRKSASTNDFVIFFFTFGDLMRETRARIEKKVRSSAAD
jgi:hypothetical protein